jgi:hypothetical protein
VHVVSIEHVPTIDGSVSFQSKQVNGAQYSAIYFIGIMLNLIGNYVRFNDNHTRFDDNYVRFNDNYTRFDDDYVRFNDNHTRFDDNVRFDFVVLKRETIV